MTQEGSCGCGAPSTLLFPCSGGSDVGAATDRVARYLTVAGDAKMSCLAGIGGRLPGFLKAAERAEQCIVIDGCKLECAARCMREAGCNEFVHVKLADAGCEKGKTLVTDEFVAGLANRVRAAMAAGRDKGDA